MICKTSNFSIHLATQAPTNHKRGNKLNEMEIWQTDAWITDNLAPSGINPEERFHFSQKICLLSAKSPEVLMCGAEMTVCLQSQSSKPNIYKMKQAIKLIDWHTRRRTMEHTYNTLYL